jgi:hypothetical protein
MSSLYENRMPEHYALECPATPSETSTVKSPISPCTPSREESPDSRLEKLGRQRPEVFKSLWAEIGFVFSVVMSQVLVVS